MLIHWVPYTFIQDVLWPSRSAASSWRPVRDISSSDNCEQEHWIDQGNEVERSKQIPLMGKSTSNLERFYLVRGGESRYRFCLGAGSNDEQAHLRLGCIAAWRPNLPMPFERIAKGSKLGLPTLGSGKWWPVMEFLSAASLTVYGPSRELFSAQLYPSDVEQFRRPVVPV
jgi:hypothetical protein